MTATGDTESQNINRSIVFCAMGLSTFFVQIPIVHMLLNSTGALQFSEWDSVTLFLTVFSAFVVVPGLLALVFLLSNKIHPDTFLVIAAFITSYCLIRQVDYYFTRHADITVQMRVLILVAFVMPASGALWFWRSFHALALSICALFSPLLCVFFISSQLLSSSQQSISASRAESHPDTTPLVMILTFEKLATSLILADDGTVRSEFENIKKLAETSDVFTDVHSTSTSTQASLASLYDGRFYGDKSYFKPDLGALSALGDGRKIIILNDYLPYICDIKRHECIGSLAAVSINGRLSFLSMIMVEYLRTMVPQFIINKVFKSSRLAAWEDLWAYEGESVDGSGGDKVIGYGKRQMDNLVERLRRPSPTPQLYVMHSFLTDGNAYQNGIIEIQKYRRLQEFDRQVGRIVEVLKETGRLSDSFILISSDTGSDSKAFREMRLVGTTSIDASIDLSNIFMLVKWPAQHFSRVFEHRVLQNEVLHIVKEGLADDSWRTQQDLLLPEHKPIRIVVPYERGTRVFIEAQNVRSFSLEQ